MVPQVGRGADQASCLHVQLLRAGRDCGLFATCSVSLLLHCCREGTRCFVPTDYCAMLARNNGLVDEQIIQHGEGRRINRSRS
jgi:hypothetical protein